MDFIYKHFIEYENAFMGSLENVGFSSDESRCFLKEISSSIYCVIKNTNLDSVIKILLSDNPSTLLRSIDDRSISVNLGMKTKKVSSGLEAIAPVIKQVFIQRNEEIVTATASLAWQVTDKNVHLANKRRT